MNGLSLFSGIGGIDCALQEYVKTKVYCEIESYCQAVLLSRMDDGSLDEAPIWNDVTSLDKACLDEILSHKKESDSMAGKLKKLTEDQVEQAKQGYLEGMSLGDLAHIFSVTRQAMWDLLSRRIKLRGNHDCPKKGTYPNRKKEFDDETINKMIELYNSGKSLSDIATILKSSSHTISRNLEGKISLRSNLRFGKDNHFYRGGKRADSRAWDIMENEVRYGRLINPEKCSVCDSTERFSDGRTAIQGHHDDYNKPLDVRWLCQKCHFKWHTTNTPISYTGEPESHNEIDIIVAGFP